MSKKRLIQIILSLLLSLSVISLLYYYNFDSHQKKVTKKKKNSNSENLKKKDNLIEGIKYVSQDKTGNFYEVTADYGKNILTDDNLILLFEVKAVLKLQNKDIIEIQSKKATYNSYNNFTKFHDSVFLIYENNTIACTNLILDFSQKQATLKDDIIYKNLETIMFVDEIKINFIDKSTKLSMSSNSDKIKIISNYNGIN